MSRTALLWIVWLVGTLVAGSAVAAWMLVGGDRSSLLIGETTGVHHQFEVACESCHAAPALSDPKKISKEMNNACVTCHEEELEASNDSHPRKKFRSPRMADYWDKIDARLCTSCHLEHKPEITRPGAVTLAMNYCVACHSEGEQDIRKDRPSHAGLGFDSCASAGCHNFHDNRALYEDFLVAHAEEPWLSAHPRHALAAQMRGEPALSGEALTAAMERWLATEDAVAPEEKKSNIALLAQWSASGHARAGVNCAGCHAAELAAALAEEQAEDGGKSLDPAEIEAAWIDNPGREVCASCHRDQNKSFVRGRHGMRAHPDIAKPRSLKRQFAALGLKGLEEDLPEAMLAWLEDPAPPAKMSVAEARIPMAPEAHGRELDCVSCHSAHEVDIAYAAVEACASCHADDHTKAYFDSPHYALWKAEVEGRAEAGTGVSCADCHMPKAEGRKAVFTNHNQNDVLRPNEKMIRPVCMACHGLGFSIDALADPDLVARNFKGRPAVHIESIEWATRRVREGGDGANQ